MANQTELLNVSEEMKSDNKRQICGGGEERSFVFFFIRHL